MELDDIIAYEGESTSIDFKSKEYTKDQNVALIKDIMAMANAPVNDTKRIIIGVKNRPGEENEILGLDKVSDQAIIENLIQENIEPHINFNYFMYNYQSKKLAILEINSANINRPYMMKKKYGKLEAGEIWIRKGTRQSRVLRNDLDNMYGLKIPSFNDKIHIGYGNELLTNVELVFSNIYFEDFPSQVEKKELENYLRRLEEKYYSKDIIIADNRNEEKKVNGLLAIANLMIGSEFKDEDKSIRIGNGYLGMPIYNNKEQLEKRIKEVDVTFQEDDYYYVYGKKGTRINFNIYNDADIFLEDVIIKFVFDKNVFMISENIPTKPDIQDPLHPKIYSVNTSYLSSYPDVDIVRDEIIVTVHHNEIRHKSLTEVFDTDLYVVVNQKCNEKKSIIKYEISAKNSPNLIKGELTVNISKQ